MTFNEVISLEKLLKFEVFLSERCTSHQSVESKRKETTSHRIFWHCCFFFFFKRRHHVKFFPQNVMSLEHTGFHIDVFGPLTCVSLSGTSNVWNYLIKSFHKDKSIAIVVQSGQKWSKIKCIQYRYITMTLTDFYRKFLCSKESLIVLSFCARRQVSQHFSPE